MSKRIERVAELLKQELSKLIKEELPEEYGIITVNDIVPTGDFKEAKVYICCLDKSCQSEVIKQLEEKKSQFQKYLGKNLTMKFTPRLTYFIDKNQDQVDKIEKILQEIEE